MKILIAVPTFESIFPDTFQSIYELDRAGHQTAFRYVRGYDVSTARNMIAQMSVSCGADYVLMVDNDIVLPKTVIRDMLDDPRDVCLGYYAHRDEDNIYRGRTSICKLGWFNYPLESEYTGKELEDLRESGQYKVQIHGGGMGCAMISTKVFRRLEYPWYAWINHTDENRSMLSEDLYFCEQCRMADIPIFTDTRAGCGHILRHIQLPE